MADGRIVIDTDLDSKGIEKGLKGLKNKFDGLSKNGGLSTIDELFDGLAGKSKAFGSAFNVASKLVSSSAAMAIGAVVALGAAFVKLYEASKQNFFENLEKVGKTLEPVIDAVRSLGQEILTTFSNITGFEFSFNSLISEAIEFESTMASVAAVMGATGEGIIQINQTARLFGAETRYSAIQVAEAFTYMGEQLCPVIEKSIA